MTTRDKIAHLHRRLGFGVTPSELDEGVRLGVKETIHWLIDYDNVDEQFPVSPHEFSWRDNAEPDLGSYRYRLWWVMRMLCTRRPLQEKLTLFWHNHFAVSDSKVEDGPMMLTYLDTLRTHGAGKFSELLKSISKDPAMMRYLDMQRSIRGHPNENFGREVMELFTLGIGNYSEADVKAAARAFTGWGYVHIFYELPGDAASKLHDWITIGRPFSSFMVMPSMHDPGPLTLLGQTGSFDGDGALDVMAHHPATAKRICTKLWELFAYENPDPPIVERLTRAFMRSKGDIRVVLHEIVNSHEFWGDKCVRKMVKSPVDLCVPVARQMGAGERLMSLRNPTATATTPIAQQIVQSLGDLTYRIDRCGLSLLHPPDVSGWRWGQSWISSAGMLERMRFRGMFLYGRKGPDSGTTTTLAYVRSKNPQSSTDVARALAELFDVTVPEASVSVLAEEIDKRGGMKSLAKETAWAGTLDRTMELILATPEMQMA